MEASETVSGLDSIQSPVFVWSRGESVSLSYAFIQYRNLFPLSLFHIILIIHPPFPPFFSSTSFSTAWSVCPILLQRCSTGLVVSST